MDGVVCFVQHQTLTTKQCHPGNFTPGIFYEDLTKSPSKGQYKFLTSSSLSCFRTELLIVNEGGKWLWKIRLLKQWRRFKWLYEKCKKKKNTYLKITKGSGHQPAKDSLIQGVFQECNNLPTTRAHSNHCKRCITANAVPVNFNTTNNYASVMPLKKKKKKQINTRTPVGPGLYSYMYR